MRLEPDAGKLARPVLRGGSGSNIASLPDLCLSLVFPRRSLPHNSRLKTRAGNALLSVHADCSNVQPHLQQYFCYRLLFCRYHLSTILRYEINFLHYQQNYYRQYTSRNNNFMSAKIK